MVSGRHPDPDFTALGAVSCPLPASCWAVGFYDSRNGIVLNEALHWNGRNWTQVPIPSPGGTVAVESYSQLKGVRCASPGDCWAVADSLTLAGGTATRLTLVLHWNGRNWSQVATPNPAGTGDLADNELRDVTCIAPADCWAVGSFGIGGTNSPGLSQALHWSGRRWARVATPDPGGTASGDLTATYSIRCASADSCWAVGTLTAPNGGSSLNLALHLNGRRWTPDNGARPRKRAKLSPSRPSILCCGIGSRASAAACSLTERTSSLSTTGS